MIHLVRSLLKLLDLTILLVSRGPNYMGAYGSEDCDLSYLMRSTFAYVVVMYFRSYEWLVLLCVIAVP